MQESLRLALRVLTPRAVTQAGEQFTTSMGRIIETRAKITGGATSWANARRDLKNAAKEGMIRLLASPPRPVRYDPFRSPVVLAWTGAGLADLNDPDNGERFNEELEPQIHLVPRDGDGPPTWLPKRNPAARNMNPKAKAIIDTLQGLKDCTDQEIVHPSVEWIRDQCLKHHREPMGRSTFFVWAAWLEWYGFIRRAIRKRTLEKDTVINGVLHKKGEITNDTTLYYIAAKAWGWAKRSYDRLKKHFARTEVRDSRHNTGSNLTDIGGDRLSTNSSPPLLRIKGAAEAAGRLRGPSSLAQFDFKSLAASLDR